MTLDIRTEGVAIGLLMGFADGKPVVVYPQNPTGTPARAESLARLSAADIGRKIALLFLEGDLARPLVAGSILDDAETPRPAAPGASHLIEAAERIELRCGHASIILEKDGHITIRGGDLVSHASGINAIRGGSVELN